MIGAIKVHHSVLMLSAKFLLQAIWVLIIEVNRGQDRILFYNLEQNIDVEGQSLNAFKVFDEFATHWTSNSEVMMKSSEAFSAESVTAVNQDPWNFLANVVLVPTEEAIVHLTRLVITVDLRLHFQARFLVSCAAGFHLYFCLNLKNLSTIEFKFNNVG